MRVQFHIYFSKNAKRKFRNLVQFLCFYCLPVVARGLHLLEYVSFFAALMMACGLESFNLQPVLSGFYGAVLICAAAQCLRCKICKCLGLSRVDYLTLFMRRVGKAADMLLLGNAPVHRSGCRQQAGYGQCRHKTEQGKGCRNENVIPIRRRRAS